MKWRMVPALLVATLWADDFREGEQAYRDGRFAEAWASFRRAIQVNESGATAELFFDRALAALRAGDLIDAEISAELAAVRGGAPFASLRDFLLGNTAHVRCQRAKLQTLRPDVEPAAFDPALASIDRAIVQWRAAARRAQDWPEARRNLERALLERDELRLRKEMALDRATVANQSREDPVEPPPGEQAPPPSAEPPQEETGESPQDLQPEPQLEAWSPAELAKILEILEQKEKEKVRVRRSVRTRRSSDVEKDW